MQTQTFEIQRRYTCKTRN